MFSMKSYHWKRPNEYIFLSTYFHNLPTVAMELERAPIKRQKRVEYRKAHKDENSAELPKKKFYRQRAHANPFSDHQLA